MADLLLVEDNTDFQNAAMQYLQSRNKTVQLARDYSEALDALKDPQYRAVITDCFFPEQTGSGKRDLGYSTLKMMSDSDPHRKDDPLARSVTKVGDLLGVEMVRQFLKNVKQDLRSAADLYWVMKKAIDADEAKQPLGILVGQRAQELGLPFVIATSTYHHDELTQKVQDYCGRKRWGFVDCSPDAEHQKATPQYWEKVYSELERSMR